MQALNGHFKEPQSHSSSLLKLQRLVPPKTTAVLWPLSHSLLELRKNHMSDSYEDENYEYSVIKTSRKTLPIFGKVAPMMTHRLQLVRGDDYGFRL